MSSNTGASAFSDDYATARERFRTAASARGCRLEAFPIHGQGPQGEALNIDAALLGSLHPHRAVVLSSGLHGVEGFFGSAVQTALLEYGLDGIELAEDAALILIHALDPYGFAWLRRFDEENVDLNRNFLIDGETYRGAPPEYAELDGLLNPRSSPRRFDGFVIKASLEILKRGLSEVQQTVAGGQYDFPRGLFFGGHSPAPVHRILAEALPRWLGQASDILHVDYHTGLGRWATYQLLLEDGESRGRIEWLKQHFGAGKVTVAKKNGSVYHTKGSLGPWCEAMFEGSNYLFVCAEFGTYSPLRVIEALRAENQAYHWGKPDDAETLRAKERLAEAFAPSDPAWRDSTVAQAIEVAHSAMAANSTSVARERTV